MLQILVELNILMFLSIHGRSGGSQSFEDAWFLYLSIPGRFFHGDQAI